MSLPLPLSCLFVNATACSADGISFGHRLMSISAAWKVPEYMWWIPISTAAAVAWTLKGPLDCVITLAETDSSRGLGVMAAGPVSGLLGVREILRAGIGSGYSQGFVHIAQVQA